MQSHDQGWAAAAKSARRLIDKEKIGKRCRDRRGVEASQARTLTPPQRLVLNFLFLWMSPGNGREVEKEKDASANQPVVSNQIRLSAFCGSDTQFLVA